MPRPKKSSDMKEKTEEEIKSSPAFHRAFYNECRKNATNEAEKQQIDKFFRESQVYYKNHEIIRSDT